MDVNESDSTTTDSEDDDILRFQAVSEDEADDFQENYEPSLLCKYSSFLQICTADIFICLQLLIII